jgi:hypothetical protein
MLKKKAIKLVRNLQSALLFLIIIMFHMLTYLLLILTVIERTISNVFNKL